MVKNSNVELLCTYAKQLKAVQTSLEKLIRDEKNEAFFDEMIHFANEISDHFNTIATMLGYNVIEGK